MDAEDLARQFGLGRAVRLSDDPVARGKQGLVWRLDTSDGSWAVKMPLNPSDEDEAAAATVFQEAAFAAGVPTPRVRRTTEGRVFATVAGRQVRVYEWVDLGIPDTGLDPALVGAVVAAIHRVGAADPGPLDPWYHEPVGAGRWDFSIPSWRQPRTSRRSHGNRSEAPRFPCPHLAPFRDLDLTVASAGQAQVPQVETDLAGHLPFWGIDLQLAVIYLSIDITDRKGYACRIFAKVPTIAASRRRGDHGLRDHARRAGRAVGGRLNNFAVTHAAGG